MKLRSITLRAALVLLGFAAWTFPLEFLSRMQVRRSGSPLDRVLPLLRPDARLGWRQRAGLRETLYGREVRTNELGLRDEPLASALQAEKRILVLGPSSAFGWGVDALQAYPGKLEGMLRERFPARSWSVVNAGQIGYSVWQGMELYRAAELRALKADVVVIAYGVNDVDRYRFFPRGPGADPEAFAGPLAGMGPALQTFFGRSYLFWTLQRAASKAAAGAACLPPGVSAGLSSRRVPPEYFKSTVRGLAELAHDAGARVVLVTSAYRITSAQGLERGQSEELYRLSAARAAQGRCGEARAAYEKARALEPRRIHDDVIRYNRDVRALGREMRVPVVDMEAVLADDGALFFDPVHPSAAGHARVASALFDLIVRRKLL